MAVARRKSELYSYSLPLAGRKTCNLRSRTHVGSLPPPPPGAPRIISTRYPLITFFRTLLIKASAGGYSPSSRALIIVLIAVTRSSARGRKTGRKISIASQHAVARSRPTFVFFVKLLAHHDTPPPFHNTRGAAKYAPCHALHNSKAITFLYLALNKLHDTEPPDLFLQHSSPPPTTESRGKLSTFAQRARRNIRKRGRARCVFFQKCSRFHSRQRLQHRANSRMKFHSNKLSERETFREKRICVSQSTARDESRVFLESHTTQNSRCLNPFASLAHIYAQFSWSLSPERIYALNSRGRYCAKTFNSRYSSSFSKKKNGDLSIGLATK